MQRLPEYNSYLAKHMENCNEPDAWISSANRLLSSAELLMQAVIAGDRLMGAQERTPEEDALVTRCKETRSTALMLYGFALECLMKACHVAGGARLYKAGKVNRIEGLESPHDLAGLCKVIGLWSSLTQEDQEALDKLTLHIEIGRYPAPASPAGYGWARRQDGTMYTRQYWTPTTEAAAVRRLLVSLHEHLGITPPASLAALGV